MTVEVEQIFVPITGQWWEPTADPEWYRLVEPCDEYCHHPVHAFGVPRPAHHLERSSFLLKHFTHIRTRTSNIRTTL